MSPPDGSMFETTTCSAASESMLSGKGRGFGGRSGFSSALDGGEYTGSWACWGGWVRPTARWCGCYVG